MLLGGLAWLLHIVHVVHHLIRSTIKGHLNVIHRLAVALQVHRRRVEHGLLALRLVREKPLVHVDDVGVHLLLLLHHLYSLHLLLLQELLVVGVLGSAANVELIKSWLLILLAISVAPHYVDSL